MYMYRKVMAPGQIPVQHLSIGDDFIEMEKNLNFYLQAEFDVNSVFGASLLKNGGDDSINIYANYNIELDKLSDALELTLCKANGAEESWFYSLTEQEKKILRCKMENYCLRTIGMSLYEYSQQLCMDSDEEKQEGDDRVMEATKIKAVIVEPYKRARIAEIEFGPYSVLDIVGDRPKAIHPFDDPVCVAYNEDTKNSPMVKHRSFVDENGNVCALSGTFLVLGLGENTSLSDTLAEKYRKMFEYPEIFFVDTQTRRMTAYPVQCELPQGTCSVFSVIEHGSKSYYRTTPGKNLLEFCRKTRDHMEQGNGKPFAQRFPECEQITAEDFLDMTLTWFAGVPIVCNAFAVNFDAGKVSATRKADRVIPRPEKAAYGHGYERWATWGLAKVIGGVAIADSMNLLEHEKLVKLTRFLDGWNLG